MPNLKSFRVFLDDRLTAVAVEIFGAFEKMVVEYQEENDRLRRLLRITPGTKLCEIDSLQFSLAVSEEEVPPEQQPCEQEWKTILEQDDPEPTQNPSLFLYLSLNWIFHLMSSHGALI
ncbi:uncharacterized protein LOC105006769 isoform X3 [Esox lucius]|uniref:uncharacterized protein LOC105006769 isoform X3 n=1 Tax=Esox lucius TaxID=8010 RepID=UPI0014773A00|nr:uncharacterized protein LOC105006769 isoform X3 [Esox lucius]